MLSPEPVQTSKPPGLDVYVERVMVPLLRTCDFMVVDNLAAHKSPRAKSLIEAADAEMWLLPPYSSDLKPIEKRWSKIKAQLRRALARTQVAFSKVIGDAAGWLQHFGYHLIQS